MSFKSIFLSFFVLSILLFSCSKEPLESQGDYFFLESEKAIMPVWVRGNIASNVFIIHLHGGPGGSSITEAQEKAFLDLETQYAVVYWDQRGGGATQGNAQAESITIEQMVSDLEKLFTLLAQKYNQPKFFLLGHSWGGALGTVFLLKPENQAKIKGWIEMDGAHNFKLGLELSRQWIIDYANSAIQAGNDVAYWQEALTWYANHPVLNSKAILDEHTSNYLVKANGYIFNPNNPDLSYFVGGSLNSPGGNLSTGDFVQENMQNELSKGYSAQMALITIPTLILWGRHDGILPVALANDAYQSLGTDSSQKSIVIFENSAHSPNREERALFNSSVISFIETYK